MNKKRTDLEHFPTSQSAMRMLSYVSGHFYDKSYVGKWMYQVMGQEFDGAWDVIAGELAGQMYVETATWGLAYHELKWQLPVRENLSFEERRKLICDKRDNRPPMTPWRMGKYLEDITGFRVCVADAMDQGPYGYAAPHPNTFKVYLIGEGTPDYRMVRAKINSVKQSHTTYLVEDRTEIGIDNRGTQCIRFANLMVHSHVFFWGGITLDGSWLLDGSVLLNNRTRYNLVPRFIYQGGYKAGESISATVIKLGADIRSDIHDTGAEIKVTVPYRTDNNIGCCPVCRINIHNMECETAATVETRSKGCWYMDGSCRLDGTKNLNAVHNKEVLE